MRLFIFMQENKIEIISRGKNLHKIENNLIHSILLLFYTIAVIDYKIIIVQCFKPHVISPYL